MAQVKVVHDPDNHTIMIFFADPGGEVQSVPFDDKTDLLKNEDDEVIGIMRCDYDTEGAKLEVSVETHSEPPMPDE
jgi:hypothetical protein